MELGKRLKQARLEAGLSQRALCGQEITRNMLSQIENGTARPSMDTLRYLAGQLGKSVSWFLEEQTEAYEALAKTLTYLEQAEEAARQGKDIYARELLERVSPERPELLRRKLLTLAKLPGEDLQEICRELPSLDEELLLRAEAALARGDTERCGQLLEAAEDHDSCRWIMLRGDAFLRQGKYEAAAACFHRAETEAPEACYERLEQCYRELGEFRLAYEYARKQK